MIPPRWAGVFCGAPQRTRTFDRPLRRRLLYPTELGVHLQGHANEQKLPAREPSLFWSGITDSNRGQKLGRLLCYHYTNPAHLKMLVEATGFEPATPWSQTKCATGLRYASTFFAVRAIAKALCAVGNIANVEQVSSGPTGLSPKGLSLPHQNQLMQAQTKACSITS